MNTKEIIDNQREQFKKRESALKDTIKWQAERIEELQRTCEGQNIFYTEQREKWKRHIAEIESQLGEATQLLIGLGYAKQETV